MIHWFITLSTKKPWRVISFTACAALVAASLSLGLRIDSNVLAMLPDNLPVAANFERSAQEFGATTPIVIAIHKADSTTLEVSHRNAAIALAQQIEHALAQMRFVDQPLFSSIDGRRDSTQFYDELETILPLTPRFMAPDQLDNVIQRLQPALVKHRLDKGPPPSHPARWHQRDPIGLWSSSYRGFWEDIAPKQLRDDGVLLAPDGNAYLVLAWPLFPPHNAAYSKAVHTQLTQLVSDLTSQAQNAELVIDWAAGHRLAANDFQAAQQSALLMTAGSLTGIILLFAVVFGSIRLLILVVCLLIPALAAGIGLGGWAVGGQLSMVVVAFAAILAGLGVDLIIHAYAAWKRAFSALCERFDASTTRRLQALRRRAVRLALPRVLPALGIATLTTSAAFIVLYLGSFRGMQQLGLISAVGLAALTVVIIASLPALLSVAAPLRIPRERGLTLLARIYRKRIGGALACCLIVVTAMSLWLVFSPQPFPITEDSRDLRPRHDPVMENQIALLSRLGLHGRQDSLILEGQHGGPGRGLSALVQARQQASAMIPVLLHTSAEFLAIWSRSSQHWDSRQRLAKEVDWDGLTQLAEAYPQYEAFWNDLGRLRHTEERTFDILQDSPWGKQLERIVRGHEQESWTARLPLRLVEKASIPAIAEGFHLDPALGSYTTTEPGKDGIIRKGLAGNQSLSYYLHQALGAEMQRLAWLAAIATAIVFNIGMRHLSLSLIGMAVLSTSVLTTTALVAALGLSWNMITIAVLPLVVGIGIDDVVHFSHYLKTNPRRRDESITDTCRRACLHIGPPTLLTSLTTGIGFGSLLLADYRGLQDMGLIAVIGILTCLVITVCALPAIAWVSSRLEGA